MDTSYIYSIIEDNNSTEMYRLHSNGLDPNYDLNNGTNLFTYAATKYAYDIMDVLLRCGANINALDNNGNTVFTHLCSEDGNYSQVIQYLINEGGDINKQNAVGYIPAELCAKYGNYWNLKQILESGHDPNSTDNCGVTLLMIACCYRNIRCVKLLLQNNADINKKSTILCQTALVKIMLCSNPDKKLDVINLLLSNKGDVNITDTFGENAFFLAVKLNYSTLITLFMDHNADINIQNQHTVTPFLLALSNANFDLCELFITMKCHRSITKDNIDWYSDFQIVLKICFLLGNDEDRDKWTLANKLFFGSGEQWRYPLLLWNQHDIATTAMMRNNNTLLECARYFIREHLMIISTKNLIYQIQSLPLPDILKKYLYFM